MGGLAGDRFGGDQKPMSSRGGGRKNVGQKVEMQVGNERPSQTGRGLLSFGWA